MRGSPLSPMLAGVLGAPFILAGGCDEWVVTTKTRIDPAGRLAREVRIERVGGGGDLDRVFRLPGRARIVEKDGDRVVLSIAAASASEIEPDFVLRNESGRPDPKNSIEWTKRDCVLFDHYVYRETFTDSVDEADRDAGTERLFSLCKKIALEAARMEAEGYYDLARFEAYLDGPAKRLFFDVVRIAATEKDSDRRARRIAARCGAEGICLDADFDPEKTEQALAAFVAKRCGELFQPIADAPPYDPAPLLARDARGKIRLEALLEAALSSVHGSEKKAADAFEEALGAVLGDVHGVETKFLARVAMPGQLLCTNGWVDEAGGPEARVFFAFDEEAIARTGHTLELQTVVPKPDVLARLPSPKAALDVADVIAVIDGLANVDEAGRARLSEALSALGASRGRNEVRDGLPEPLRAPFDLLMKIGGRERGTE